VLDSINDPIFLDFAHTNEVGNRQIASFLFRVLIKEVLASNRDAAEVGPDSARFPALMRL